MVGLAARANEDRVTLGICLMLVAYALFSCVDVSAKWLVLAGHASFQVAFMRYAGHLAISVALIARGGLDANRFATEKAGLVILRALFLMLSTICNFVAVRYLPLTLTATISFSAPIMICALSMPLLGERVGPWRWGAICVGFVGLLIAVRPFDAEIHWAVLFSIGSAFSMAMYTLLTRKLSGSVSATTMQFYAGLFGTVVLLPFALATWVSPAGPLAWALLLGIGPLAWVGHEAFSRAHAFATAGTLTPFSYAFILYMTAWSAGVFGQYPDALTILGASIVTVAGLVIWARERRMNKARKLRLHP